jgi:hypothetical protein
MGEFTKYQTQTCDIESSVCIARLYQTLPVSSLYFNTIIKTMLVIERQQMSVIHIFQFHNLVVEYVTCKNLPLLILSHQLIH